MPILVLDIPQNLGVNLKNIPVCPCPQAGRDELKIFG